MEYAVWLTMSGPSMGCSYHLFVGTWNNREGAREAAAYAIRKPFAYAIEIIPFVMG